MSLSIPVQGRVRKCSEASSVSREWWVCLGQGYGERRRRIYSIFCLSHGCSTQHHSAHVTGGNCQCPSQKGDDTTTTSSNNTSLTIIISPDFRSVLYVYTDIPLNPHDSPKRQVPIILFLFYRWESRGTERLGNSVKVIELVSWQSWGLNCCSLAPCFTSSVKNTRAEMTPTLQACSASPRGEYKWHHKPLCTPINSA